MAAPFQRQESTSSASSQISYGYMPPTRHMADIHISRRELERSDTNSSSGSAGRDRSAIVVLQLTDDLKCYGIRLQRYEGKLYVAGVIPDSVTANAGLQFGDRIQAINGVPARTMSTSAIIKAFGSIKSPLTSPKATKSSAKKPFKRAAPESPNTTNNNTTTAKVSLFVTKSPYLTTYTVPVPNSTQSTPATLSDTDAHSNASANGTDDPCAICAAGARCGGQLNTDPALTLNGNEDLHRLIGLNISEKSNTLIVKPGTLASTSGVPNGTHALVLVNNVSVADAVVLTKFGKNLESKGLKPSDSNSTPTRIYSPRVIFDRSMDDSVMSDNDGTSSPALKRLTLTLMPTAVFTRLIESSKISTSWL